MNVKKRAVSLACALCLLAGPALAAGESGYADIEGGEWFAPAVAEMTEKGIMTGVADGLFAPYEAITRATVVTVLWRMAGAPDAAVEVPFTDAAGTWYDTAAAWGKGTGIATGYGDGSFGGGDLVTREQLATFLYRYAYAMGQPVAEGALGLFSDAGSISPWAEDAMRHAVGAGILQGTTAGTVEPQGIANRAALAVTLQRMLTPAAG
ncbi:hypothetical protein CE91St43_02190 [Oscillospiraceae bacterium]|nr:hypothetical protein CE91St43_02190 [Oscillospiraceae bacterium]